MRGLLSTKKLEEISNLLPALDNRFGLATFQEPGVDIQDLDRRSTLGVALVCLNDAGQRFYQTRIALHEAFACLSWYREESPKAPLELQAIALGKFYADYAALLLYAIREDIATFITYFLGIDADLKQYLIDPQIVYKLEGMKVSSNAAKIGIYMRDKFPDHSITKAILWLHSNRHWKKAIEYRNLWVHEKPPIIYGLGIEYDRESRVEESDDGKKSIGLGGGSKAKYTVDQLLEIVLSATFALAKTLSELVGILICRREEFGEKFDFDNNKITIKL